MKYQLLKPILNFKEGTVVETDQINGYLGNIAWDGWEIPLSIIERNKDWFMPILGT